MASNPDAVREAARRELARRELARRQAAQPQGQPQAQQTAQQPPSSLGGGIARSAADIYQGLLTPVTAPLDLLSAGRNAIVSRLWPKGYEVTINGKKERRSGQAPGASQLVAGDLRSMGVPEPSPGAGEAISAATRGLAGSMSTLGMGGLMAGAASPVTRGVGQVLASQPAAQLASGAGAGASADVARQMGGGPLAQTAAGVAGGLAAGGLVGAMTNRRPAAPAIERLREEATRAYKAADDAGVTISQTSLAPLADDITATVRKLGYNQRINPEINGALEQLAEDSAKNLSLSQIETLRKVFKGAAASQNEHTQMLAYSMINKLDDFVAQLNPAQVSSGDPAKAQLLYQARNYYSRAAKGEEIAQIMENASIRGRQNVSLTGYEQALRVEFGKIARNQNRLRLFRPDEQAAIKQVASGGGYVSPTNVLRYIGKLAPTNVVSGGVGAGLGYAVGGPAGAVALPAIGGAARLGATGLTLRHANLASELVRRGAALPPGGGVLLPVGIGTAVGTRNALPENR